VIMCKMKAITPPSQPTVSHTKLSNASVQIIVAANASRKYRVKQNVLKLRVKQPNIKQEVIIICAKMKDSKRSRM
jgi:hypothetical protein